MYGGGVYSPADTTMVIRHSILDSNVASLSGGGLYANASSSLKAFNSIVRNNSALSENGGGVYMITHRANGNPSALLSNLTFADNRATAGAGGGIYRSGGVYVNVWNSSFWSTLDQKVVDCTWLMDRATLRMLV